jgi:hypothetical protein
MRALRLILFLLVPAFAFGQSGSQSNSGADMEALKALLKGGSAAKVQVLHMPDSALTRVAVTPQVLRSIASATKTFSQDLEGTFDPVLSGISVKRENHAPDLRWGVLFYDSQNHEIASLFVDKFGQYGYLNGEEVSFDAGFLGANIARRLHKTTGI